MVCIFFFNDTATTEIYTLSLHDALPICENHVWVRLAEQVDHHAALGFVRKHVFVRDGRPEQPRPDDLGGRDRKSTRLNSSHSQISYAVFCLKKKKTYRTSLRHLLISTHQ